MLKKVAQNISGGCVLSIDKSNNEVYCVDRMQIVNINDKTCKCRQGKDLDILSKHLCSVIQRLNMNSNDFVSKAYSTEFYYQTYSKSILPLTTEKLIKSSVNSPVEKYLEVDLEKED